MFGKKKYPKNIQLRLPLHIYIYTICGIVITVGRVLNGRPEHITVKNQRVNSCDQTFYYCQFRATQIVRYSSDKIA